MGNAKPHHSDAGERLRRAHLNTLVVRLRTRGMSAVEIREALLNQNDPIDISAQRVRAIIREALAEAETEYRETAAEMRALENARIDAVVRGSLGRASEGDPKAARVVLSASARRSRLNGLDAAQRIETTINGSVLHELGTSPEEIKRQREALGASYNHLGGAPEDVGTFEIEASAEEVE